MLFGLCNLISLCSAKRDVCLRLFNLSSETFRHQIQVRHLTAQKAHAGRVLQEAEAQHQRSQFHNDELPGRELVSH